MPIEDASIRTKALEVLRAFIVKDINLDFIPPHLMARLKPSDSSEITQKMIDEASIKLMEEKAPGLDPMELINASKILEECYDYKYSQDFNLTFSLDDAFKQNILETAQFLRNKIETTVQSLGVDRQIAVQAIRQNHQEARAAEAARVSREISLAASFMKGSLANSGEHGFVYLIRNGDLYKIGMTYNFDRRMSELTPDQVVKVVRVQDPQKLERSLHQEFSLARLPQSEWFRLSELHVRRVRAVMAMKEEMDA